MTALTGRVILIAALIWSIAAGARAALPRSERGELAVSVPPATGAQVRREAFFGRAAGSGEFLRFNPSMTVPVQSLKARGPALGAGAPSSFVSIPVSPALANAVASALPSSAKLAIVSPLPLLLLPVSPRATAVGSVGDGIAQLETPAATLAILGSDKSLAPAGALGLAASGKSIARASASATLVSGEPVAPAVSSATLVSGESVAPAVASAMLVSGKSVAPAVASGRVRSVKSGMPAEALPSCGKGCDPVFGPPRSLGSGMVTDDLSGGESVESGWALARYARALSRASGTFDDVPAIASAPPVLASIQFAGSRPAIAVATAQPTGPAPQATESATSSPVPQSGVSASPGAEVPGNQPVVPGSLNGGSSNGTPVPATNGSAGPNGTPVPAVNGSPVPNSTPVPAANGSPLPSGMHVGGVSGSPPPSAIPAPGGATPAPTPIPSPSGPSRFHLHRPGTDVDGDLLTGNAASDIYVFRGNVVLHSDPKVDRAFGTATDSTEPITVTADEIDVDRGGMSYVAKGNVHFTQGARSGRADTAMLNEQTQDLDLLGNADVLEGAHRVRAAKMHYNAADRQFHGAGDIRIYEPVPTPNPNTTATPPPKRRRRLPI